MRLLHTSDWHLGRSFHREDLLARPGGVRRPPGRDGARRAGRRGAGGRRRLRPGPAQRRRGHGGRRRAAPAGRDRGTHRGHQRQPRLGPPARLRRRADRRRRRPPAHRRPWHRHARCCSTTRTGRWPSTGCPTSSPPWPPTRLAPTGAATPRCWARPWHGSAPTWRAGPPAPARSCSRTRSSPAGRPATASATSPSAGWPPLRCRRSTASTTSRWATCTAGRP